MLGHRRLEHGRRRLQPRLACGVEIGGEGRDHAVDDRHHPAVLLGHGLGVDGGHAGGLQLGAGLGQEGRQLFHAGDGRPQALGPWGVVTGHQAEQGVARGGRIDLRIPGPGLQHLVGPDPVAQLVLQHLQVDLVLAGQFSGAEGLGLGQEAAGQGDLTGDPGGGDVVDLIVEAVVALLGGEDGLQRQGLVDVARGEAGEALVGR